MMVKPEYRIPTMAEIVAIPWNGFNVVSTFSGCGGSCLGYRMAGFRVAWANEFIPAAAETYRANHPDTILDTRDIRDVTAADIIAATGIPVGEIDVFDGSPPCASFSTSGSRERGWGKVKQYSDTAQRTDDLFFDYARLLRDLHPKTFIAENVSGLVKGKAKGYFLEILKALKACGYRVSARLLDAQWLGVPQARQRLIFVGVRQDLGLEPVHPTPLPYRYTLAEVCPHIQAVKCSGRPENWQPASSRPAPTIVQSGAETSPTAYMSADWVRDAEHERRKYTIPELKRICSFPDDFVLTGTFAQQWERLGRAVPPLMMRAVAETVRAKILCQLPK